MDRTLTFFLLVFFLSAPLWLIGALTAGLELPVDLPVAALQAVVPAVAAGWLVARERGASGVRSWLRRAVDARKIPLRWYAPILSLWPVLMLIAYGLMLLARAPLPAGVELPGIALPLFVVVFLLSAAGEQLGWQAYAFDRLYPRIGPLATSLVIGVVWAVWHVVPFAQIPQPPTWILWQCLAMLPFRVLIGWIYLGTGRSVFATIAFQASANVSQFSFPNYGSAYDPFYAFVLLTAVAPVVTLLVLRPPPRAGWRRAP